MEIGFEEQVNKWSIRIHLNISKNHSEHPVFKHRNYHRQRGCDDWFVTILIKTNREIFSNFKIKG